MSTVYSTSEEFLDSFRNSVYQLKKSVGPWSSGTVVEIVLSKTTNEQYVVVYHPPTKEEFVTQLDNLIKRR